MGLTRSWESRGQDIVIDASGMGRQLGAGPRCPWRRGIPRTRSRWLPLHDGLSHGPLVSAVEVRRRRMPRSLVETIPQSWAESDLKELVLTRKPTPDPHSTGRADLHRGSRLRGGAQCAGRRVAGPRRSRKRAWWWWDTRTLRQRGAGIQGIGICS